MFKTLMKGFILLALLSCCVAEASDLSGSWYLQFNTGLSSATSPNLKLDNVVDSSLGKTMDFGIGAGYQMYPKLRADFTVTYRGGLKQDADFLNQLHATADFQSTSAMANFYYDFSEWHGTYPFVTAGLGYVHNHLDTVSILDHDLRPVASIQGGGWSNLGAQFGGGLALPVRSDWFLDIGYRYLNYGKYESSDLIRYANGVNQKFERHVGEFSAHNFFATLRIRFY